jgi:glutaryl-CoA dehydrogenase
MVADLKQSLGQSLGTDFYLIDELLTEEERRVRDTVRAFCDQEVIPIINDYWERAEFPFELIPSSRPSISPDLLSKAMVALV